MSELMTNKTEVLVIGELNVDLIFNTLESFPETGKEKLAGEMSLTLGSSAAIFASNLSSLGMRVAFLAMTGNDVFGRFCKDHLDARGVDTSLLIQNDTLKTGATIVLNYGEDRAMITHQGAMKHLGVADIHKEWLATAKHLHFSSYFLQPGFKSDLHLLFRSAKEAGLTTSLDVQWDPAEKWDFDYRGILPYVDLFLPNEAELLNIAREGSIEKAIRLLGGFGKYLFVKRGNQGSVLSFDGQIVEAASFRNNQVVDAIGAGDSFNAGVIFKFLQGQPLEHCQVFGNLMGAISTTACGGTGAFINYTETMKIAKEKFGYEE